MFANSAHLSLYCSAFLSLLLGSDLALLFFALLWYVVLFRLHDTLFPPTEYKRDVRARLRLLQVVNHIEVQARPDGEGLRADFLPKVLVVLV